MLTVEWRTVVSTLYTAPGLFELAAFGARYPAPPDVQRPGNLRLIAVTLKEALRRAGGDDQLTAELIDDEPFAIEIEIDGGVIAVRYEPLPRATLALSTDYEALVSVLDGQLSPKSFMSKHVTLERGSKRAAQGLFARIGKGMS